MKVKYVKEECIGCGACAAVAPDYWDMDGDKSVLKGSKEEEPNVFFLGITEEQIPENQDAADSCPVECIHLIEEK